MSAPVLDLSLIPPLGEPRPQPTPEVTETTLPNGLRVVVVPRPGVPLVELRLRVPFAASSARAAAAHTARTAVLAGAVLLGTARHDQAQIAQLLQAQGAELSVS
ncbi:MAG: M16 family metallopeptidase, partial [Blastococcus sp.]